MKMTPFGQFSKQKRLELGVTLRDQAIYLGITSGQLSSIETGRNYELTADIIAKTFDYFQQLELSTERRTCKNRNGKTVKFAVYKLKGGAQ